MVASQRGSQRCHTSLIAQLYWQAVSPQSPDLDFLSKGEPTVRSYWRQIEAADRQIDVLVYELYGLGEEEIGVVEGGS